MTATCDRCSEVFEVTDKISPRRPCLCPECRKAVGRRCTVCGGVPVIPQTGMCAPCTFGEGATVGETFG